MPFATSLVNAANLDQDNFFETTIKSIVTDGTDTNIYLNALPDPAEGFLTIEPTITSKREIIFYNSKGADYVTCPSAASGRGVGGTTAQGHVASSVVRLSNAAEYWRALKDGFGITTGAITGDKLSTSAITLGVTNKSDSFFSTASNSFVDVTNFALTVTVPTGGRWMKLTVWGRSFECSSSSGCAQLVEGTTCYAQQLQNIAPKDGSTGTASPLIMMAYLQPTAGVHTYKVQLKSLNAGLSVQLSCGAVGDIGPMVLAAELI